MKFKEIIKNIIKENLNNALYQKIINIKPDLIKAAQTVYDQWDQNEDGEDEVYGVGGICDDIASAMCDVVSEKTEYDCFYLYNEYECHTSIYVYDLKSKLIYNVDIPPHVYETGGGYTWKKIKDIEFDKNDIQIVEVNWEDFIDEDGNVITDF